jgi:hypothetical protein
MRKGFFASLIISLVLITAFFSMILLVKSLSGLKDVKLETTELMVCNSDSLPIKVYLTLNSGDSKWITDVNGIFGITSSGLQGSFILGSGDTLTYITPKGKAIAGNLSFGRAPVNCPDGVTICEFTLNNYNNPTQYAQETIDLSCLAGVSYFAKYTMSGGGVWSGNYVGYDTITTIENHKYGSNNGIAGVYPVGCDDCTASVAPPPCVKSITHYPQSHPICNVQRNGIESGGTVLIEYLGKGK